MNPAPVIIAVVLASLGLPQAQADTHLSPHTAEPQPSWNQIWTDGFDGPAGTSPSSANWLLRTGTNTDSVETASTSTANVSLDGAGKLTVKAIRGSNWTSGRIDTQRTDFAAQPGEQLKFAAVLKQPDVAGGIGYWPGFRSVGAGGGKIDIAVDVNGRGQLTQAAAGRASGLATCAGCKSGYHEYAQVIDRTRTDEEIRFYLDGQQTWIVRESQVGVTAWQAAVQRAFSLRLELAIGGSVPNSIAGRTTPVTETTSGGVLSVDSVTVSRATGTVPAAMTDPATPAGPSVVRVTGTQGNWQLQVDGRPWEIKGMTYGLPQGAADGYMRDLRSAGVNTVRTWDVDDGGTPVLLDRAAQQGIKVIVGLWLNHGADYVNDTSYKNSAKTQILNRVNALKNRSGVLMWDVGNEVILTMQNYGLPADVVEQRRIAYVRFVNEIAQAIRAADPNHPVTATDAYTPAWRYHAQYAPALNLLAVNSYHGVNWVKGDWVNGGYTKPYVLTEGGADGEWEVALDGNGVPTEPTDAQKRDQYTNSWNAIKSHPGVALGATEFHYGPENDYQGVWLNTFTGGWHRLGFYALHQAYTGQPAPNTPPTFTFSAPTSVAAGSTFTVSVNATDPQGDPIRYNLMAGDRHITGNTALTNLTFTQNGTSFSVKAPDRTGVWKLYVYAFDGQGNAGIETRSFRVG